MASTQLIQQPLEEDKGLISAHEPIKLTLRLSDSTAIDTNMIIKLR